MNFKPLKSLIAALLSVSALQAAAQTALIETNQGNITVELDAKAAPISSANFIKIANKGEYNGTIFHRVIRNFMIQGGGFEANMQERPQRQTIINEAGNGLKNDKYTIAMARTSEPNSATAQFFINTKNNDFLNHQSNRAEEFGYAVFGKVTSGFEVVDKIGNVYTTSKAGMGDVPIAPIVIQKVTVSMPDAAVVSANTAVEQAKTAPTAVKKSKKRKAHKSH